MLRGRIDRIEHLSHAEIWLEIATDDREAAAAWLERHGVTRRDEIEPLPADFRGFWVASPADVIHLISE